MLLEPEPIEDWLPVLFSQSAVQGTRVALLVSVDVVDPEAFGGWDGRLVSPGKEARALGGILDREFGFEEQSIPPCGGNNIRAIRDALEDIVARSFSIESIVIFLSGHGGQVPITDESGHDLDSTFVAFDGQMRSAEVDAVLSRSAASRTTLIVSAAHSGRFAQRPVARAYEVIASCKEDQVDMDGPEFSSFMSALLPDLAAPITGRELAAATKRRIEHGFQYLDFAVTKEHPLFIGGSHFGSATGAAGLANVALGTSLDASNTILDRAADLIESGELPATGYPPALEWWHRGEASKGARLGVSRLLLIDLHCMRNGCNCGAGASQPFPQRDPRPLG